MQLALSFAPPPMRLAVLGSGSAGNAVVVESGRARLMIDAGFSCRELEARLAAIDVPPATLDAVLLTHEHEDHIRGAVRFARRHGVPVCASSGTLDALALGEDPPPVRILRSGALSEVGGFVVEPFGLPHDAREPLGLVLEDRFGRRVGLVADLGTRSRLAWGRLSGLDALVLEANHDLDMLRNGPYPWPLKQRVASRHGHLSNRDAAEGLRELAGDRLGIVVLYHLSRTNNTAALALATVSEELARIDSVARVCVASQERPSGWLLIGGEQAVGL